MGQRDWTQRTNVERALQTLAGIAQGIALDYEVTDGEISALTEWLSLHHALLQRQPFQDLADLVSRVVADGIVTEDEREEVLDWCQRFTASESVAVTTTTDALRRLHGVLHGVAADGEVTDQEAIDLQDWLEDHADVAHVWPFCDLRSLLARVLADHKVDATELGELLTFCDSFTERAADGNHTGPVGQTLTAICDHGADVTFDGRVFCFTGAASRLRANLEADVAALGGLPVPRITRELNYLVIGAKSQPAWAFANYGRKIEEVMSLRQAGHDVRIIHEHALAEAMKRSA